MFLPKHPSSGFPTPLTIKTSSAVPQTIDTSPQFWLGLQMDYELDIATDRLGESLHTDVGTYREAGDRSRAERP